MTAMMIVGTIIKIESADASGNSPLLNASV